MTVDPVASCDDFDLHAEELALGEIGEPLRGVLLAHAAQCPSCRSLLDSIDAVIDRLLLAAPEIEPPAGFENRVLHRLTIAPDERRRAGIPRRGRRGRLAAAAVAAVLLAGVATMVVTRGSAPAPSGAIISAGGVQIGSVQLLHDPVDHILVAISAPQSEPGTRHCELQRPDGTWQQVGTWQLADIQHGVWAAGIATDLLDATTMRIVTDGGAVLATATIR